MYDQFGSIAVIFPGWTPKTLKALAVSERKYWSTWATARHERITPNA